MNKKSFNGAPETSECARHDSMVCLMTVLTPSAAHLAREEEKLVTATRRQPRLPTSTKFIVRWRVLAGFRAL